jgi:tetratricopeptide (TPR) repeat protein
LNRGWQMNSDSFGRQLRYFRRRARDPQRGGSITQERLTHLLYDLCGLDYSFAAISDWERGKSHVPKDHRATLVGLVTTLGKYGGLLSLAEANSWLAAGNYRSLDDEAVASLRTIGIQWPELADTPGGGYTAPFLAPPPPFQPIIGRDEALLGLRERLLDRETVTISAVRGLPGVGKTTLALALAHDPVIQQAFPDGVFWIGLGRNPDIFFHLGLWANALAIHPSEIGNMTAVGMRTAAIRSCLSNRAALLIIDDAWQARHAHWFRLGGKDCAHVVTTRLPAVTEAFGDAHQVVVETLAQQDSIHLLSFLAPQVYQQFPETIEQLARSSAGLPLTLVLMGNYLRQQTVGTQRRRAERALLDLQNQTFRFQIEMPQEGVHAHPSLSPEQTISLASIIGISEQALPDAVMRGALHTLGLFPPKPSSFTEVAAMAIMEAPLETLDALVDAGLVETKGQERYQIHQSITDYLGTRRVPDAVRHRFVHYYADWLAGMKEKHQELDLELENLLAAGALAGEIGLSNQLVAIAGDFFPFLEKRALWSLVDELLPTAVEHACQIGDHRAAIALLHKLGRSLENRRERDRADRYWHQAVDVARQHSEIELLVSLLSERSIIASAADEDELARQYLEEALTSARAAGYQRGISMVLGYLGRLSHQSGHHSQTPRYLDEAITIARAEEMKDLLCGLLILRGAAASYSETVDAAEQYYLEALIYARTVGRKDQLSAILTNLGEIETNRGREERAAAYLEEALDIVQESGSPVREAHIRKDLGILAMRRGDSSASQRHFEIGLTLAQADHNDWLSGYIEVHWAELLLQSSHIVQAEALVEQVMARLPDNGKNRYIIAIALFVRAQVAALQGDRELARQRAGESATALQAIGHARAAEVAAWLQTLKE